MAGVAAESPNIAEEALSLIKVDYEPMPGVLTAPEGAEEDASLLHRGLKTQEMGVAHDDASNVAKRFRHTLGDVEQGFGEDQVREAVRKQTGKDLDELPARDLKPLVEGAARKVNEGKEAANGNG